MNNKKGCIFHIVQIYDTQNSKKLFDWTCSKCNQLPKCRKTPIRQEICIIAKEIYKSNITNVVGHNNSFFNDDFFIKIKFDSYKKFYNKLFDIVKKYSR